MVHHGDNLEIMRDMEACSVDLIYADPPFNSGKDWGEYDDRWKDAGEADPLLDVARRYHSPAMAGYLAFMQPRLRECRRVLNDAGSIYLHCDPTMSHYLKVIMDGVFGSQHFLNEIVWHYQTGGAGKRWFAKKHDIILAYVKTERYKFLPNAVRVPRTEKALRRAANLAGGANIC